MIGYHPSSGKRAQEVDPGPPYPAIEVGFDESEQNLPVKSIALQHVSTLSGYTLLRNVSLRRKEQPLPKACEFRPCRDGLAGRCLHVVDRLAAMWANGARWHLSDKPHPHRGSCPK